MISIFPLLTFHLYIHVATFKRHFHIQYISLSWYGIQNLWFPTRKLLALGFLMIKLKSSISKMLRTPSWHGYLLPNTWITDDYVYIPFVVIAIPSFLPLSWLTRVLLIEQKPIALKEHLSSPLIFGEVCVAQSSAFCVVSCGSLIVLLAIVLFVLLRFLQNVSVN